MSLDLNKLSDEELRSIASGDLKSLPEETLRLISGAQAPTGSVSPSAISSGPETAEKFQAEADAKRAAVVKSFEENSKKDATTNPMTMEGVLTSTPALVTGAALLGALTTYAAPKVYKTVKERFMSKAPDAPIRIEPIGFESFADTTPVTTPNANPLDQTKATLEDIQARTSKPNVAPTPMTTAELDAAFAGKTPAPGMPSGPDVPPQFSPGPVAPAGNIPPAPVPTYGISEAVASKGDVKQAIQQTIAKEIDKPVYPDKSTFKSLAEIPPGFEFRPDVGNLDRSLGNILGLENRAYARDLFNEGKPFGQAGPGKNQLNTEVSNLTKQYFQQLQSQIPETLLGRDARQAQKIPSEFGTFAKNTDFGKGVKVAGVAGTLFAAPSIVNAAQQGNYGSAAIQAADLATDYLPFIAQIKQALSPSSAGEGSSNVPSMGSAALLGSPYAQTEVAQRARRDQEMARKIAGRTGAAVPPQFRR